MTGQEVKAVRGGQMRLTGAYVTFHKGNAVLTNAHIGKYAFAGPLPDYDPTQSRRLLLHKREIRYLQGKAQEKGLTIVPLSVYTNNRSIKVEIGVGRGRKAFDKREVLKDRAVKRAIRRQEDL